MDGHKFGNAAFFLIGRNIVSEAIGWGAFLGRVGEASHAVKTGLADKLFEFLELFERLSWVADNQSGANGDVG